MSDQITSIPSPTLMSSDGGWFKTAPNKGLSHIFKNSFVTTFVDAEEYFADLRHEVQLLEQGDFIFWIGFDAGETTPMPAQFIPEEIKSAPPRKAQQDDKPWFEVLKDADAKGVKIRALLNLHPKPSPEDFYRKSNYDLVEKLNSLENCNAINDFRYLYMNGTHHQKLILTYSAKKGLIAYTGSCDIENARINDKWCEVQNKITGDAALELYNIFSRRYFEHSQLLKRVGAKGSISLDASTLKAIAVKSGNFLIQVATTYGNPKRSNPFLKGDLIQRSIFPNLSNMVDLPPTLQTVNHPHRIKLFYGKTICNHFFLQSTRDFYLGTDKPLIEEHVQQKSTYVFAPNGHTGIYLMIQHAIANSKKFIYLEDQYLVCDQDMGKLESVLSLLVKKLKEKDFKKLIILCTRIDEINEEFIGTGWEHRNHFIQALLKTARNKVEICQYKDHRSFGKSHFYIHSKTWVFDDELLITGSANCNRRGYSHDSELNVAVYDQDKTYVKHMRKKIWSKRLNAEEINRSKITDSELEDFLTASKFWNNPNQWGIDSIENCKQISFAPKKFPDGVIPPKYRSFFQQKFDPLAKKRPTPSAVQPAKPATNINFHDNDLVNKIDLATQNLLWDLVVDPDGT